MTTAAQPVRVAAPEVQTPPFDVDAVRRDFPILGRAVRNRALDLLEDAPTPVEREAKPLVWFTSPRELDA
ncbi:MAG: hypothetical protein QF391_12100 [Myxococcota bacterium]|nr:hypothetical protein [Myxococcota bacterium]